MTEQRISKFGRSLTILGLISVFAALTTQIWSKNEVSKLEAAFERQYRSYILADELRQSSDDLTRLARTYVVTGDAKFEQQYFDILAIRNEQRNALFTTTASTGIFWPPIDRQPRAVALRDLLKT
ncbi:MAG: hypothetical protein JXQ89_04680 [Pelagimonas sp.]